MIIHTVLGNRAHPEYGVASILLDDFGIAKHETNVPILRVPAIAFLYLLGKAEADGQNGKM